MIQPLTFWQRTAVSQQHLEPISRVNGSFCIVLSYSYLLLRFFFFSIHKKNTHTPIHIHAGCFYRCGLCDAPGTRVFGRSAHPGADALWRLGSHIYGPRASRFVELYRVEGEFKSWVYKPREAKIHLIMCLSITLALFASCFTVISISTLGDFTK